MENVPTVTGRDPAEERVPRSQISRKEDMDEEDPGTAPALRVMRDEGRIDRSLYRLMYRRPPEASSGAWHTLQRMLR